MPRPLFETQNALASQPRLRKVEFLPIPSIVADFQLNMNTEVLLRALTDLWRDVVGLLRLEGLHKNYRLVAASKPADGKLVVVGKDRIQDGEFFTLSDGVDTQVFEFDVTGNGVTPGNTAIDISTATSLEDVRLAVENAINNSTLDIAAQPTLTLPPAVGGAGVGGEIDLFNTDTTFTTKPAREAQNGLITDTVLDEGFIHRGMEGARLNNAIGEVYVVAPGNINDGETFVIPAQGANPQEVYEFDKDASVTGGNIAVDISAATTAMDVATALANAINANAADMTAEVEPTLAEGYLTALAPSKLNQGETFTLNDGINPAKVFEFDKTGAGVTPGNVQVDISAATLMQHVREAMLSAINGSGLHLTAFNPGFGSKITLLNSQTVDAVNTGAIVHTVVDQDFLTGPMQGFKARVTLLNTTKGTAYNQPLSHTVIDPDFQVVGMAYGAGDGWDVTGGRCAFEGYNIELGDIPRMAAVVGKQNFLKVRVIESRLTAESDPTEIQISIPGVTGTQNGANLYRWSASLVIEAFDAAPPALGTNEVLVVDEVLCEFDATNGQTIVANTEVPLRVTKFGRFLEPQDVTTKVSKFGDSMTGKLTIVASGADDGLSSTGGATNGKGGDFVGQGTAPGVRGTSHPTTGDAGVEGVGGTHGVKGTTAQAGGIGVLGEATSDNATGVKGTGATGIDDSTGGPGVHARGGMGILVERLNAAYPHARLVAAGNSGTPPTNVWPGDLWVPASGAGAGMLYIFNGTAWDTVRASTLGKVGDVQDVASTDRDVLRYKGSNSRWERVKAILEEKMYLSPQQAIISVANATLGNFTLELNRGEISITATGTSAGASLVVAWVVPIPPGFEAWGTDNKHALVIPVNPSNASTLYNIEVYDSNQSVDYNPGASAIGFSGAWQDTFVLNTNLSGNYLNNSNNQGNMVVQVTASFGNGDTVAIGGLYIKSRNQSPFGSLAYAP